MTNRHNKKYDYLIVGSGVFGSVCARELTDLGYRCLVVEKRDHIGGNVFTENVEGINVHRYGAHIFHTNDRKVWEYVNRFASFNSYIHKVFAEYKGEKYSLPFNMRTFRKIWSISTPEEARNKIEKQRFEIKGEPKNLEEQAIRLVGRDVYEILIKGYTEKQWGRDCKDLPPFIIRRLPVRFDDSDSYFDAEYQGIPIGGYTKMIENMLKDIEVVLDTDFLENKAEFESLADKIIYTGPIDAYYDFVLGSLEYRTVRFQTESLDIDDFQGNAVVNYTDRSVPYTRIIEHKWFECEKDKSGERLKKTIISREYPSEWKAGEEPYYPINDEKNYLLYLQYRKLADKEKCTYFGGRLGEYKYYDMDQVIMKALELIKAIA